MNTSGFNPSGLKVGSVIPWPGDNVPAGYLECDGASLSRTAYANLFNEIGTSYGNVDANTFNLPDYRGEFLRGMDDGAGVDPDAASRTDRGDGTTGDAVGTKQGFAIENITGNINGIGSRGVYNTAGGACGVNSNSGLAASGSGSYKIHSNFDASRVVDTSTETRPMNSCVMYCIKY